MSKGFHKVWLDRGENLNVDVEAQKEAEAKADVKARLDIIRALSERSMTVNQISQKAGLKRRVVQGHLLDLRKEGGAIESGGHWRLKEIVPVPVPKEALPEVERLLARSMVQEHRVSIPTSVASSATDLVGKPDVLKGIVQKLMAGSNGGHGGRPGLSDKDFVDDCVQAYLAASSSSLEQARGGARGFDGMRDDRATDNARRIYTAISRARLFCVRPERFIASHHVADRFTTEMLAGLKWEAFSGRDETREDSTKLIDAYYDHGTKVPFPDPLPFESMFICYGRRLDLQESGLSVWGRISPDMVEHFGEAGVFLYGHLLWVEGDVPYAFACIGIQTKEPTEASPDPKLFPPGFVQAYGLHEGNPQWIQPVSLDPWIVPMLVKDINEHKAVSQSWTQTLSQRMDRKKKVAGQKTVLPLPEPFYLVPLKDELIEPPDYRSNAESPKSVEWSHRWDVRGHEVVRVIRGKLPLSVDDAAKLRKRGYRLYLEGRVTDAGDEARTLKRGVRGPGLDEWIGVLSYWREAFVKGPTDKPYVPGARV